MGAGYMTAEVRTPEAVMGLEQVQRESTVKAQARYKRVWTHVARVLRGGDRGALRRGPASRPRAAPSGGALRGLPAPLQGHVEARLSTWLAQGLPIATGVIEGACRHMDRDRMDLTGARWRLPRAEAILKLRSLHSSGDSADNSDFHKVKYGSEITLHATRLAEAHDALGVVL